MATTTDPPKRKSRDLVSQAEYARMRGCSREAVRRAAGRKQIHLVDGLVDPLDADKTWPRAAGPRTADRPKGGGGAARSGGSGETRAPSVAGAASAAPPAANGNGRPADLDYWDERANHERLKARLAELEIAQLEGKLLDSERVRLDLFEAYRTVRDALLTVPDRIAAKVAGEADPAACHRIITSEIRQALLELNARFRPTD